MYHVFAFIRVYIHSYLRLFTLKNTKENLYFVNYCGIIILFVEINVRG